MPPFSGQKMTINKFRASAMCWILYSSCPVVCSMSNRGKQFRPAKLGGYFSHPSAVPPSGDGPLRKLTYVSTRGTANFHALFSATRYRGKEQSWNLTMFGKKLTAQLLAKLTTRNCKSRFTQQRPPLTTAFTNCRWITEEGPKNDLLSPPRCTD